MNMPELTTENITPIGQRLLIEPFLQPKETSEGLEVAEGDGHATPIYGKVLKVGENCRFKVGDALLFRRYAIDSLKTYTADGDKEFYLLEESEVIGVVSGKVEPKTRDEKYPQIKEKNASQETTSGGKEESPRQKGRETRS